MAHLTEQEKQSSAPNPLLERLIPFRTALANRKKLSLLEALRIEDASWKEELSEYHFRRTCGVILFVDCGEESDSVGRSIREEIVKQFKEDNYELFVDDGPRPGSFSTKFFMRAANRLDLSAHKKKIEDIVKRLDAAVTARISVEKLKKVALSCVLIVGTSVSIWEHHQAPTPPTNQPTASAYAQPAYPPDKETIPQPLLWTIDLKELVELIEELKRKKKPK